MKKSNLGLLWWWLLTGRDSILVMLTLYFQLYHDEIDIVLGELSSFFSTFLRLHTTNNNEYLLILENIMQRSHTISQFHQDRGSWPFQRATASAVTIVEDDTMLRIVKTGKFLSSQVNDCMTITTAIIADGMIIGSIIKVLLMTVVVLL